MIMPRMEILGVKICQIDLAGVLQRINVWLAGEEQKLIVTVNPEFILEAQGNELFRRVLNNADLATVDGFGLALAGKILQHKKFMRVTGVDLSLELLNGACPTAGIYLLGGAEGVAETVKEKFSAGQIVGAEDGGRLLTDRWELEDNETVIRRINNSGANLLLVAFGQVKQEMWLDKNLKRLPGVKVAIGIGGTFDFLSGKVKRAPAGIRRLGLEWLYRLINEPKRFRRIWRATVVFVCLVINNAIKKSP